MNIMDTPQVLIAHPKNDEQINVLKVLMQALKIKFEISKVEEKPYNPEFVAKILESRQQVKEGKTVTIELDDIWKE